MHGNGFYRFTRYLILGGLGLLVLCILAFIKNWDIVTQVFSSIFQSLTSGIVTLIVAVIIIRAVFR